MALAPWKFQQVRRPTGLLNSCIFDPMPFDFDITPSFFERFPRSTRDVMAVSHGTLVDWVETPEAHVIKADLPGMCFTASSLMRPSMFVCHKIQGPQLDMRLTVIKKSSSSLPHIDYLLISIYMSMYNSQV
jgi:hypothetical protein